MIQRGDVEGERRFWEAIARDGDLSSLMSRMSLRQQMIVNELMDEAGSSPAPSESEDAGLGMGAGWNERL